VLVQIEQMRQRLAFFAAAQSQLVRDGWQIFHAERPGSQREEEGSILWNVDGQDVKIVGYIDRIDFHEERRLFRVLDYKTFDIKKEPDKTHRNHGEWTDLQLPLYRHLAVPYGVQGPTELGYFLVAKTLEASGVLLADWDSATLELADEKAREVISRILANDFGQPIEPAPEYDDWAYICLADVPR